jgi:hypothetical protein
MKPHINIIFITAFSLVIFSCQYLEEFEKGNGEIVTERRTVSDFNELKIGGNFEVLLKKGDQSYVQIITDENLLVFIDTEVHGDVLEITQQKKLISKKKIKLIVDYVNLDKLRAMGAALIKNEGYLDSRDLTIRMDGAGIIDLKIHCNYLDVVLSGAGIVKLAGEVQTQDLNLTGAGKLEAFDLESMVCSISVGGLGGAEIFVTEKLDAKIEGIGGIKYTGNPVEIITEVNGLGKIRETDLE